MKNSNSKNQLRINQLKTQFEQLAGIGNYTDAVARLLAITKISPTLSIAWSNASACFIHLERWDDAIECGLRAATLKSESLSCYDALAHAYGALKDWDNARRWGRIALSLRDQQFGDAKTSHDVNVALPAPPAARTRRNNIIAYSLFGANAKYCETAIINAIEQPSIYPGWTCVFYVDESVPDQVIARLEKHGAQVTQVVAAVKQRWPGPMWRLLAYDRPGVHRVIFRDADSVISSREAKAVDAWINSGKHFHQLRDSGSHTELMLAGMWGVVKGALPPLNDMVDAFLASEPVSQRFADQYFLRMAVWPYARQSLIQHDSVFGFMDSLPFPDLERPLDFHVGYAEGSPIVTIPTTIPDGTPVDWTAYRLHADAEETVCSYRSNVLDGKVVINLPARYAREIQAGKMDLRLQPVPPTA